LRRAMLRPAAAQVVRRATGVGSVRFKRWRPFVKLRPERSFAKETVTLEDKTEVQVQAEAAPVLATPFQAVRLVHAFHVGSCRKAPREDVTVSLKLNVDLRSASVRGVCKLPHGVGADVRVLAFCADELVAPVLAAGADFAGLANLIEKIRKGWTDFDRALATPELMPEITRTCARVLGPRKLMPNLKSGTVVTNVVEAVAEAKSGAQLEYRAVGDGDLIAVVGHTEMANSQVLENMKFLVNTLIRSKPKGAPPAPDAQGARPGKLIKNREVAPDEYVMAGILQVGNGPGVALEPKAMLPSSSGYFR